MRHYTGTRAVDGTTEVFVHDGERKTSKPLPVRADLVDHRAARLDWGLHNPAGSSQLALALCADAFGNDKRAKAVHRAFQARFVDEWKQGQFMITDETIRDVCPYLEKRL